MKQLITDRINKTMLIIAGYMAIMWTNIYWTLCDIFDDIQKVSGNAQSKIIETATVLLPLVIVIDILCIVFTRDQRKIALEASILITAIVAFVALLIINNGDIATTLKNLVV